MASKKSTAHRPSEAHKQWVKARNGDTVINTAYDPSKKARPESRSRDLRPSMGDRPMGAREAANLVRESTDPEEISQLVMSTGSPTVISAAVKNDATDTETLSEIYNSTDNDLVRSRVAEHPNVPLATLDDKDFDKKIRGARYSFPKPKYSEASLAGLSDDRLEKIMVEGALQRDEYHKPPFRGLCLKNPRLVQDVTNFDSLTTEEIKGLDDDTLAHVRSRVNLRTNREIDDVISESLDRGVTDSSMADMLVRGPHRGGFNREGEVNAPNPGTVDRVLMNSDEGYSTPHLYRYASPAGRRHLEAKHPGRFESQGRILSATEGSGKTVKDLKDGYTSPAGVTNKGRSFNEYHVQVDVAGLERAGVNRDDVPTLMSMTGAWNGSSRWDPNTGVFSYEIDSGD